MIIKNSDKTGTKFKNKNSRDKNKREIKSKNQGLKERRG